jgi:hypothetical protein
VLIGCLLVTIWTVILFHLLRNDHYRGRFLILGIISFTIAGSVFAADAQDFVFRYLLWGANFSLLLSIIYHRIRSGATVLEQTTQTAPMEDGQAWHSKVEKIPV